jgi:hypothetical protein
MIPILIGTAAAILSVTSFMPQGTHSTLRTLGETDTRQTGSSLWVNE